jgi:hypothetical protein
MGTDPVATADVSTTNGAGAREMKMSIGDLLKYVMDGQLYTVERYEEFSATHPEAFLPSSKAVLDSTIEVELTLAQNVALAEKMARRNGGVIPTLRAVPVPVSDKWDHDEASLAYDMAKRPDAFAHIEKGEQLSPNPLSLSIVAARRKTAR